MVRRKISRRVANRASGPQRKQPQRKQRQLNADLPNIGRFEPTRSGARRTMKQKAAPRIKRRK